MIPGESSDFPFAKLTPTSKPVNPPAAELLYRLSYRGMSSRGSEGPLVEWFEFIERLAYSQEELFNSPRT